MRQFTELLDCISHSSYSKVDSGPCGRCASYPRSTGKRGFLETISGKCLYSALLVRQWIPVCVNLVPNVTFFFVKVDSWSAWFHSGCSNIRRPRWLADFFCTSPRAGGLRIRNRFCTSNSGPCFHELCASGSLLFGVCVSREIQIFLDVLGGDFVEICVFSVIGSAADTCLASVFDAEFHTFSP